MGGWRKFSWTEVVVGWISSLRVSSADIVAVTNMAIVKSAIQIRNCRGLNVPSYSTPDNILKTKLQKMDLIYIWNLISR